MGNQDQIRKIELKWEYLGSGCGRQNDMHPLRIIQYSQISWVSACKIPNLFRGGWVGVELT